MDALSQYGQSLALPMMGRDEEMMFDLYANRPDFAANYYPTLQNQQRIGLAQRQENRLQSQQDALSGLANRLGQGGFDSRSALAQLAAATGDPTALIKYQIDQEERARQSDRQRQIASVMGGVPSPTVGSSGQNPLSVRNNNAGNLRDVKTGEFRQFATPQEGVEAMARDLTAKVIGRSPAMVAQHGQNYVPNLRNILTTYAPPTENDTEGYIDFVSKETGIDPNMPLTPVDVSRIMPAMIKMEGGQSGADYFSPVIPQVSPTAQLELDQKYNILGQLDPLKEQKAAWDELDRQQKQLNELGMPQTDIGKLQRDEAMGLVPVGSTQQLIDQKNRQLRKEQADLAAAEKAAKMADEQAKVTKEVADTKVNEAFNILKDNTFGVGGLTATASLYAPGKSTDADKLDSVYSTIKSVISLDKLMEMKKASPTGASGFGALSAPELQLLVDSVSALDVQLPKETQIQNLNTISRILGYGKKEEKPSSMPNDLLQYMTPEERALFE